MRKELDACQLIERSVHKRFRKELWTPFLHALKQYSLLSPGDSVAVCISGGKDSMLLAMLMKLLHRFSDFPFSVTYLSMDPGYSPENRLRLEQNAKLLGIPLTVFETDIFAAAAGTERNPCYLCARMRRGSLYAKARELGCNKIALGHHLNDVIETTVMAMFYGSQLQTMPPKLHADNFPGMELIRPMYRILERDVQAWARYNRLTFLNCACRMTEKDAAREAVSKRREVKDMIEALRRTEPDIELRIFASLHSVNIQTFPGWKEDGQVHSFLEKYRPAAPEAPGGAAKEAPDMTQTTGERPFYGCETDVSFPENPAFPGIRTPGGLYEALLGCWQADTCAPRMRSRWHAGDPTLGQCSVTAFLAQDVFGGDVYGITLPDGSVHCFNKAGGCVFDLTSAQFPDRTLDYAACAPQRREDHFAKEEKRLRYETLKQRLRDLCLQNEKA